MYPQRDAALLWKELRREDAMANFQDFMERQSNRLVKEYAALGVPHGEDKQQAKEFLRTLLQESRQYLLNWEIAYWLEDPTLLDDLPYLNEYD